VGKLSPTRGKKETTDHPPIYPTGYASRKALRDDRWKIYQLVVRRFLATLSGPAKTLRTTLRFESGGEPLTTSGTVVTEEGWLGVYFYGRRADEELPALEEGDVVEVVGAEVLSKETQPPGRYGQGRLITVMEDLGLGTKATRPNIIQNLYDRGYVHGDPLIPTEKGIAVARALKNFASEIASHEMTAELERSMDAISEGRISKDSVVDESRDVLRRVYENLTESEQEFADLVWSGIRGDETLGECPESGHNLIIRRSRKSGKRFVGCQGYPECRVTYPLPQKGTIIPMCTQCDACGSPEIKVLGGKRPWVTCINMDCPKKQEQRDAREEGGERLSQEGAQELEKSTT
jgi:DNA topoisomerase-1